jgi:uncharacterized Zn-binding protein involved in type VI secretion
MATIVWTGSSSADWSDAQNWSPATVPTTGDAVSIAAGTPNDPTLSGIAINDMIITLGAALGGVVTMTANSVAFAGVTLAVGGGYVSCSGTTTFGGQLIVSAPAGSLTIESEQPPFTLTDPSNNTTVVVSPESALLFLSGTFVTAGVLEIDGSADIAAGVIFGGDGLVLLEAGGNLTIEGSIDSGQLIALADAESSVSIANPTQFLGMLGLAPVAGARIAFPSLAVQSASVTPAGDVDYVLMLYSGQNGQGAIVAKINVCPVNEENFASAPLTPSALNASDFVVSSSAQGAIVTFAPGGLALQQSIPFPIVADPNSNVSLQTIFQQAFGVSEPPFLSVTLIYARRGQSTATDQRYWGSSQVDPQWVFEGDAITASKIVFPSQWGQVELAVGNNIAFFPQFQANVAEAPVGSQADYVLYTVWTVPPGVFGLVGGTPGAPTAQNVVSAAKAFLATFPDVPNTNLCNWIADNVAAAAGAPMPLPDARLDPADNVEGGFWRIAYTGQILTPVQNWSSLVEPGDIVRLRWLSTQPPSGFGGHSTTIIAGVDSAGEVTVYDNCYCPPHSSGSHIGIHPAKYWNNADPTTITIYRLGLPQQNLICGGAIGGVLLGSPYNNLIRPACGATVITAGKGNNTIQGVTANLNGVMITDFHAGDSLNFTDLDASGTTAAYDSPTLNVYMAGQSLAVASIGLPGLASDSQFSVTSDAASGSIVALAS